MKQRIVPVLVIIALMSVPISTHAYFSDTEGSEFRGDIDTLVDAGVLQGDGAGQFLPDEEVTRGEMAKLVVKGAQHPEEICAGAPHFTDVSPEHSLYAYIETAYCLDISKGRGNGLFEPSAPVLRQEAVAMLMKSFRLADMKAGTDHFVTGPLATTNESDTVSIRMDDVDAFAFDVTAHMEEFGTMSLNIAAKGHAQDGEEMLDSTLDITGMLDVSTEDAVSLDLSLDIRSISDMFYFYLKQCVMEGIGEIEYEIAEMHNQIQALLRTWYAVDMTYDEMFDEVVTPDSSSDILDPGDILSGTSDVLDFTLEGETTVNRNPAYHYTFALNPDKYLYKEHLTNMRYTNFYDVSTYSEFKKDINDALELKIIKGYDATSFGPGDTMKRDQAARVINQARNVLFYADAPDTAVNIIYHGNIYVGVDDGYVYMADGTYQDEETSMTFTLELSDFNENFEVETPDEVGSFEVIADLFGV